MCSSTAISSRRYRDENESITLGVQPVFPGGDGGSGGHMDRETSLEYVNIQTDALKRAQKMIEGQQPF
jgi:hypothetical protein